MKLIKTKVETNEYQYLDDIVKEVWTSKYLFGFRLSKNCETVKTPIPTVTEIKRDTHRFGEVTLKKGMKVISRSNEPDPLMVGEIVRFETLNNKYKGNDAFPIFRDYKDDKEYISMTILMPYSDELFKKLKELEPIEQYNYLVYPHGQLKEKYGIKYRTFE